MTKFGPVVAVAALLATTVLAQVEPERGDTPATEPVVSTICTIPDYGFFFANQTLVEITCYEEMLAQFDQPEIDHFPFPIPYDWSGNRVSYRLATMPYGGHLQLAMLVDRETLEAVERLAIENAVGQWVSPNDIRNIDPFLHFYVRDTAFVGEFGGAEQFDDGDVVYVLQEEGRNQGVRIVDSDFLYDMGEVRGITIRGERSEVIYWIRNWRGGFRR
jgi:hypothetical protein